MKLNVTLVNTKETQADLLSYISDKKVLGLDIETSWAFGGKYNNLFATKYGVKETNPNAEGLDPYLSNIVMVQIGDLYRQFVIDARVIKLDILKNVLEDPNIEKVGHNMKFEYKHFRHNGIYIENIYDTMVAEKVLYTGKNLKTSLLDLVYRYNGFIINKSTRLEFANIGDSPFTREQVEYGAKDILFPLRIRESQLLDAKSKQVTRCFDLEFRFIPVLGDIEYNGMNFNQRIWMDTYHKNKALLDPAEEQLSQYVLDNYIFTEFVDRQYDMFSDGFKCNIQWSSPTQVKAFFHYLGVDPVEKGKSTINAKVVKAYLPKIKDPKVKEFVKLFLYFAGLRQSTTTFGEKFLKYVHPITGRLHSNYNQIVNTGRISSSAPNLQNIPADLNFRRAFDAPDKWKIVNADYSGQEQIILANKSGDKELQAFYLDGHSDMHSFIASKIYNELKNLSLADIKKNHKDKRQVAKAAGFAINYGGTGYTIAMNLGIDEKEGDEVYDAYFKAFPNLKQYFDRVQKQSLRQGYILIDPVTKRKNWFKRPESNKERNAIKKKALNYPIQGEAGGITKLAPILFRTWIRENNLQDKVLLTNLVHDEINVEATADKANDAAVNLELKMKQSADIWCKTIPLHADAVITEFWQH